MVLVLVVYSRVGCFFSAACQTITNNMGRAVPRRNPPGKENISVLLQTRCAWWHNAQRRTMGQP
jgi:hypothetical protein